MQLIPNMYVVLPCIIALKFLEIHKLHSKWSSLSPFRLRLFKIYLSFLSPAFNSTNPLIYSSSWSRARNNPSEQESGGMAKINEQKQTYNKTSTSIVE